MMLHYCTGMEEELSFARTKLKLERERIMELQVMEETTIRLKQDLSQIKAERKQLKAKIKKLEGRYNQFDKQWTYIILSTLIVSILISKHTCLAIINYTCGRSTRRRWLFAST